MFIATKVSPLVFLIPFLEFKLYNNVLNRIPQVRPGEGIMYVDLTTITVIERWFSKNFHLKNQAQMRIQGYGLVVSEVVEIR